MRSPIVSAGLALSGALFLALGSAQPASAQLVQVALCMEGGCSCLLSGQTVRDVELLLGTPAPPGAESMTLVAAGDSFSWRSQTPAQIDASFGGPGECQVQLEPPLIPEDGTWRMTTGATDASACPLFAMTGQAPPAQMAGETREIRWGGWFMPHKLMSEAHGGVAWTKTGDQTWRGVVVDERRSDGSGTIGASVVWSLTLVSPTEITGRSVFEYDISSGLADAAAMAVLRNMQCRTVTPFRARKVG